MLHTPVYDTGASHVYCGPTAISAVSGEPISKIHKMLRRARKEWGGWVKDDRGRRLPIKGVYNSEMLKVMKRLGYKAIPHVEHGMTFREFLDDRGHMGPFIVNVTGHYIAVSHGMLCDNSTKTPIPVSEYSGRNKRVQRFWLFK